MTEHPPCFKVETSNVRVRHSIEHLQLLFHSSFSAEKRVLRLNVMQAQVCGLIVYSKRHQWVEGQTRS
jgi:hypothetical protein